MKYLHIKNWDKWQTYRRDRGQPPWIKVHRRVMRNLEWLELTDAERGQLVAMWLLAADHDGVIPASPQAIQKICFMTKPLNLNKFIELGFLENDGCQPDANLTPERRQPDAPKAEESREEKIREEETLAQAFKFFWLKYPKKKSKGEAEKAWMKIKPDQALIDQIMEKIKEAVKSYDWIKESGKYIPYPATWLNKGGWKDEFLPLDTQVSDITRQNIESFKKWGPPK